MRLGLLGRCDEILLYCPFNPTVVRLGPAAAHARAELPLLLSIPLWCDWDDQKLGPRPIASPTFNPTVVRLGPRRPGSKAKPHRTFQSHCGAIGTRSPRTAAARNGALSIPLWCDWDRSTSSGRATCSHLSIPLWCDWDTVPQWATALAQRLSIPLWCDWDAYGQVGAGWCCRPFNPTVVRLGLIRGGIEALQQPPFQSHCGAIGTP